MNLKFVAAAVVAVGLAIAGWFFRGTAPVVSVERAVGLPMPGATPQAAGVRKCVGAGTTSYVDGPCPAGSREVAANGGTMTVTAFPKPSSRPSALASGVFGGPIVTTMDPDERDRLRDRAIDDAANRR